MNKTFGAPALRKPAIRVLCIALILLLLVASPVMAKTDDEKLEKIWPGQGVGPARADTPVPTTEPTVEPTVEQTPDDTAVATPETTSPSPSAPTPTATSAGGVADETVEPADTVDAEGTSATNGDGGNSPLLLLIPAVLIIAAGVIIAARRREPPRDSLIEPPTAGGEDTPASVRTIVQGTGSIPASPVQPAYSGFPEPLASKYRNAEYLGQGGIARVYRAERISDGRVVAVKIPIVPDEQTGTHFMREIRFWERLHHPNILAIYAANILPVPYVEMEYTPHSLKDCQLPLSPEGAVRVVRGIAAGLSFAHETGVIHRDIKPENILCAGDRTPKITDWGLGSVTDGGHRTQVGGFSPGYAAPEQLRPSVYGNEDVRTDLYQLGVLFFELMTGTPPFVGAGFGEVTLAVLNDSAPLPSESGAPTDVYDAVILRCLEKEKEKRFFSVEDFCDALLEAAGDTPPHPEDG
ncbi:serine/threonine-protein kinase [Methanogenium organophilum]|uniref:Protein kinase n=1 Tax=Methanogenium organophilum TaxID=2199 RepID=A0A9X9S1P7_METOG|nr:serine/threonine-protein kinase [Methanogenium organophilum]WAI00228.1 protein kinase [Methanogenium organophilum]